MGEGEVVGRMTGGEEPDRGALAWWDARYLSGDTPWDTGTVPPEVVKLIESAVASRGWALDLGCGSGVTSRYLAARGFRVLGVDLAQEALRRAQANASANGLPCLFVHANTADLRFVHVRASLAVDIGCFHSLAPSGRTAYIRSLAEHLLPGAHYLLFAFFSPLTQDGVSDPAATPTVTPADIAAFAPQLTLLSAAHGQDRGRPSAWFLMRRADRDSAAQPGA